MVPKEPNLVSAVSFFCLKIKKIAFGTNIQYVKELIISYLQLIFEKNTE